MKEKLDYAIIGEEKKIIQNKIENENVFLKENENNKSVVISVWM